MKNIITMKESITNELILDNGGCLIPRSLKSDLNKVYMTYTYIMECLEIELSEIENMDIEEFIKNYSGDIEKIVKINEPIFDVYETADFLKDANLSLITSSIIYQIYLIKDILTRKKIDKGNAILYAKKIFKRDEIFDTIFDTVFQKALTNFKYLIEKNIDIDILRDNVKENVQFSSYKAYLNEELNFIFMITHSIEISVKYMLKMKFSK